MTRAQAIERASRLQDGKYTCDNLALHRRIAESAYDAALIAGLHRAERIVNRNGTDWITTIEAIRAEITRLKGAKAK